MSRIGFITAGFGTRDQVLAGQRLANAARGFSFINYVHCFELHELKQSAPKVWETYKNILSPEVRGFGYFAWKPELIRNTLIEPKFDLDLVIWADAGCEINRNILSEIVFRRSIKTAIKRGYFFYDLEYPEFAYTKNSLLKQFPDVLPESNQVQATYLMISRKHLDVAHEWMNTVLAKLSNIDLSESSEGERSDFKEHRFDQSVLSLVVKNAGLEISRLRPPGGIKTFKSLIRSIVSPIWTVRNRTGQSVIKELYLRYWRNLFRIN